MEFLQSFFLSFLMLIGLAASPVTPVSSTDTNQPLVEQNSNPSQTMTNTNPDVASTPVNDTQSDASDSAVDIRTMLLAGGCFWCVEADVEKIPGVIEAVSGYAGGTTDNPTYENYSSGGHREVVEVTYDANQVSFEEILIVTLKTTDPTDDNGTFADRGNGYSAAFYYETPEQKQIINALIAEVDAKGPYSAPLAIDIESRPIFWPAEDYHQDYYKGALSRIKYGYYRNASGRNDFIERHWGDDTSPALPWRNVEESQAASTNVEKWHSYQKPTEDGLRQQLDVLTFKVTQKDGTEPAGSSPLDKIYEPGVYVDVLSSEPLFSSRDKFDSGTGWPSFTKPITSEAVTEHEDNLLWMKRIEVRSAIADNHLGHVFTDGPADLGGLRYCMNGVSLRFIPLAEMAAAGYGEYLSLVE